MAKIKKKTVIPTSHSALMVNSAAGFKPKIGSTLPVITPLVMFTTCVSGNIAIAPACTVVACDDRGKNVPAKNSMGVMNRNVG